MAEAVVAVGGALLARAAAASAASAAIPAAAFSTGIAAQQALERVRLPQVSRTNEKVATFKLMMRVCAASCPGFETPVCGFESVKPFVESKLGSTKKETEFADFSRKDRNDGVCADECPWRFGDMLTFTAQADDVFSSKGLRLRLRVRRDYVVGPFHFSLQAEAVAEGGVDFRGRVLPACVEESCGISGRGRVWVSPVLLVPLFHVQGGRYGSNTALGEPVAHVAVSFAVDADPELILNAAPPPRRSSFDTFCAEAEETLKKAVDPGLGKVAEVLEPVNTSVACKRAEARAWSVRDVPADIGSPETNPDAWICKLGNHGQVYWHPKALGPAPWEAEGSAGNGSAAKSKKGKALRVPEERPEDWISHQGVDGRTFWHNRKLGPAPWEEQNTQLLRNNDSSNKRKVAGGQALFLAALEWGRPREGSHKNQH